MRDLTDEEEYALAVWGCDNYGLTIARLEQVGALTMDAEVRNVIFSLHDTLINEQTEAEYRPTYWGARGVYEYEKTKYLSWRRQRKRDKRRIAQYAAEKGWTVLKGGADGNNKA